MWRVEIKKKKWKNIRIYSSELRISLFFYFAYSLLRLIIKREKNVIFYAWSICQRSQVPNTRYQQASKLELISRGNILMAFATTTHYIIAHTRAWAEVRLFFEEHFYAFYVLRSISLNFFNNKPRKILLDLIDRKKSVNEAIITMIFYPLVSACLYQRTCREARAKKWIISRGFLRLFSFSFRLVVWLRQDSWTQTRFLKKLL